MTLPKLVSREKEQRLHAIGVELVNSNACYEVSAGQIAYATTSPIPSQQHLVVFDQRRGSRRNRLSATLDKWLQDVDTQFDLAVLYTTRTASFEGLVCKVHSGRSHNGHRN